MLKKILLSAFLLVPLAASANMLMMATATPYVGPLDVGGAASGCWALRACSQAVAQSLGNAGVLRRGSDNATCTVNFAANGNLDLTVGTPCGGLTVTAWLNATAGAFTTLYDQSGNAQNATQTTAANQPQIGLSCIGSLPCGQFSGSQWLSVTLSASISQPFTISTVSERTTLTSNNEPIFGGAISVGYYAGYANTVYIYGGSGALTQPGVNDNVLHSIQYYLNGASSGFYVDGTNYTPCCNPGTSPTFTAMNIGSDGGSSLITGYITEVVPFSGAISNSAVCHNQAQYWGLSGC